MAKGAPAAAGDFTPALGDRSADGLAEAGLSELARALVEVGFFFFGVGEVAGFAGMVLLRDGAAGAAAGSHTVQYAKQGL